MSDDVRATPPSEVNTGVPEDDDLSADTERFRRFARREEADGEVAAGRAAGVPFRLLTLLAGLVALAVLIYFLFL